MMRFVWALALGLLSAGHAFAAPPPCTPAGAATPICGISPPEDMELLPDGRTLLVSAMHGFSGKNPEGLAVVDLATEKMTFLPIRIEKTAGWGDPACAEPTDKFGFHGIHLSARPDGALQVLAINHRGREAIEMLEIAKAGDGYALVWRGCVVNTDNGMFNDVAAVPSGGFIASVMFDRKFAGPDHLDKVLSGQDTGYLSRWKTDTGFVKVPASDGALNNGVQVDRTGRHAYYAAWPAKQVRKVDLAQGREVARVTLDFMPDNLTLDADGTVLVAGIEDPAVFRDCFLTRNEHCPNGVQVARLDAQTLKASTLYRAGPGMLAGGSVAVRVGRILYIGSFTGDRMLKVRLDNAQ